MKVMWLGHNLAYPPKGGALQRNYNLLREIARKCEVHVLAFDQPVTRPANVTPQDCIRGPIEILCICRLGESLLLVSWANAIRARTHWAHDGRTL